jgi:hypothetical protein
MGCSGNRRGIFRDARQCLLQHLVTDIGITPDHLRFLPRSQHLDRAVTHPFLPQSGGEGVAQHMGRNAGKISTAARRRKGSSHGTERFPLAIDEDMVRIAGLPDLPKSVAPFTLNGSATVSWFFGLVSKKCD